jgi:hypothetical protein
MKRLLSRLLLFCSFVSALVPLLDSSAAGQTVGPNINLSKATGNQYETAVAINPKDNNQIFVVGRNEVGGLATARSSDGGVTWTSKIIGTTNPAAPGNVPRAYGNASVAWDDFGNLFLAYLSQNSSTSQFLYVTIALSTDGGANFYSPTGAGAAIIVPPNGSSYYTGDQPTVTVGPGSGGFAGSVWVTYFSIGGIWVSGAGVSGHGSVGTFASQPLPSQPPGVNFGDIAVGPTGEVIVTYGPNSGASGTIYTQIDPDGLGPAPFSGATPAASVNLGGFSYIPAQPNWGIDPEAGLAYDRSNGPYRGRVYLVYTDAPSVGSADTNIFVAYSDNQGATWSTPVRVNDDAGTNSQFLPHISLDQSSGMIAVTWYDARNSPANDTAQYFGAFSSDGGATFGANFQISAGMSNQANSIAALKKADYGDYTGNAFVNGRLVPAWADNSNSTGDNPDAATNFDVYAAIVQAPVAPPEACSATNATITFVNKWWLDVVVKAGDPVTHVVYTPTPAGTTFVGVTGFAVGELVDYVGTLDAVLMCHATSMTVKPAPAPIVISPATLPNATAGVPYSAAITVTGGVSPTKIVSVTGLPVGLTWNGSNVTGIASVLGTSILTVKASDARGFVQTSYPTLQVVAGNYTIPDQGTGTITAFGDHYIYVGTKLIIWDAKTRYKLNNASQIAVGMLAKWKGKRDPATGAVLASQLDIN